jgi:phosphoribosylformimino-5-aminoimidazole carboxamide ribonucleotide (ProFAR) isomerase
MGVRRAQDMAKPHARQYHVVDIAAAAAQQPRILEPRHRLTEREFTH